MSPALRQPAPRRPAGCRRGRRGRRSPGRSLGAAIGRARSTGERSPAVASASPRSLPLLRPPPLAARRRWRSSSRPARSPDAGRVPVPAPLVVALHGRRAPRPGRRRSPRAAAVVAAARSTAAGLRPQPRARADAIGVARRVRCAVGARALRRRRARATSTPCASAPTRLDRERELLAEQAVAEERVRIAQELHDVVAHNVSLIVVQAQALGATVDDPRVPRRPTGSPTSAARRWPRCTARCGCCAPTTATPPSSRPSPASATSTGCSSSRARPGWRSTLTVEGAPRPLAQTRRPVGLPDRPGGADERDQARRARAARRCTSPTAPTRSS